jgi:hypothetical protein
MSISDGKSHKGRHQASGVRLQELGIGLLVLGIRKERDVGHIFTAQRTLGFAQESLDL